MTIYPAMDLLASRCVRLYQGDYEQQTLYNGDPIVVAAGFQQAGAKWLHVVDLAGAKDAAQRQLMLIKRLVQATDLAVQTGGGIRCQQQIDDLLMQGGVQRVMVGSLALQNRTLVKQWVQHYGERLLLALDVCLDKEGMPRIATNGWQQISEVSVFDLIEDYLSVGLENVLCTDIGRDGTLAGPNVMLYRQLIKRYPRLHLLASGGIGSVQDIEQLDAINIPGVVIGKALYEGRLTLEQLL